jgi:transposase
VINALRAHVAELGIVASQGREGLKQLLAIIADEKDARLPIDARAKLIVLAAQLQALHTMIIISSIERRLMVQHRASEESKRVATVPGIGILGASAIAATVTDASAFRSGRDFAAWIGLVPRQDSTGGQREAWADLEARRPLPAAYSCGRGAFRCYGAPSRTRRNIRGVELPQSEFNPSHGLLPRISS